MSSSVNFLSFAVVFKHSWKKLREEVDVRAHSEFLLVVLAVKLTLGSPKLLDHLHLQQIAFLFHSQQGIS